MVFSPQSNIMVHAKDMRLHTADDTHACMHTKPCKTRIVAPTRKLFFLKQGWTLDDLNEIRGGAVMNFPSNRHYSLYSINTLGSDRLGRLRNCSRRPSRESFVTWENWGSFFSSQSPKFILRSVLKFQGQFHSSPCMEGPLGPLSPTPKSPFLPLILPSNHPLQTSRPASFGQ